VSLDKLKLIFSTISEIPKSTVSSWQSDLVFQGANFFVISLIYVWIAYPEKAMASTCAEVYVHQKLRHQQSKAKDLGIWILHKHSH